MFLKDAVLAYLNKLSLEEEIKTSFNKNKLPTRKLKQLKNIVKNPQPSKQKEIPSGTQLELLKDKPTKTKSVKPIAPQKPEDPKSTQTKPVENNQSKNENVNKDDSIQPAKNKPELSKKEIEEQKRQKKKDLVKYRDYSDRDIEKVIEQTKDTDTLKYIALNHKGDVEQRKKALEKYYSLDQEKLEWVKGFFDKELNIKAKELALEILKKDQKYLKDVWSENKTKEIGAYAASLITDKKYLKEIVLQKSSPKTMRNVLETIEDPNTLKQIYYQTNDPEVEAYIEKKLKLTASLKKILAKVKERLK